MIRKNTKIKMIKTSDIYPNPYQVRRSFDRKGLVQLCDSVKEVGIISPVTVRATGRGFEIICGERRLRAAVMAGLKEIPAIIVRAGDAQCAQISMIENIQRKELSLSEEAEGYYNLLAYHGLKKERLLKALSVDSEKISEKLRLLTLGEKVRYMIEENNIPSKTTKEIVRLRDKQKQLELTQLIIKEELSCNEVKEAVDKSLREMTKTGKKVTVKGKTPIYINTVTKTVDLLKQSGAETEISQTEEENFIEFRIKIYK